MPKIFGVLVAKKWFWHSIDKFRISVVIFFASTFQNNSDFPVKMLATFTKIYESKQKWRRPFHEICGVRLCRLCCYLNDFEPLQKEHHIVLPFSMFCEVFYKNIHENVNVLVRTRERRIEIWIKVKINWNSGDTDEWYDLCPLISESAIM